MDVLGCAPGQPFLCFHCRQPFSIPGPVDPSANSGKTPEPPPHVAAINAPPKPVKFTEGSGEFLVKMTAMLLAILIVWGALSALGIKADVNRVKRIIGFAVLFVFLAVWAIKGLIKLAAFIRSLVIGSPIPAPGPLRIEDAKPSASSAASGGGATNLAPGVPPLDRGTTQWWLFHAGQVVGPYETAAVLADARIGRFTPETQICQVGGEHWLSISGWLKQRAASGAV